MAGKPIRLGTWVLGQDWFGDPPYVPPTPIPADPIRRLLTRARITRWHVEELDRADAPLGTLDGVAATGGYLEQSIHTTIRGTGRIVHTREAGAPAVDWPQRRLKVEVILTDEAGTDYTWPMGVFIPATPHGRHSDGEVVTEVTLYDKLLVLDRAKTGATWGYDAGTNPIAAVADLIVLAGETSMALTETDKTLANPRSWEPGTSYLRIINDLLASIDYFSLWCDGNGQYRANPNVPPASRPIAWDFRDNAESIYVPDWTHEADGFNVPNHVVLVGRGDGDAPALEAEAFNHDPDSPWNIARNGLITHAEQGVEAADQGTLDALAQRRLVDLSQVTSSFDITHALLPNLNLNDAVTLANQAHGTEARCVVQSMRIPMEPGGLVTTALREVVS